MKKWIQHNYHIMILFAWCMVPLIWFVGKGEKIINGLDTNFPLDPEVWFQRRFFVWNDTINAGIDASSSTSGWFFHSIQYIPFKLGLSLQMAQIVSLLFWSTAIIVSAYYFASTIFPKSKLARLTLTFIYSYNIYLFNTWENVKVANLALVVGIPLLFGLLHRLSLKKIALSRALLFLVPISFVTAGSGINPAYFIALIAVSILFGIFLCLASVDRRPFMLQIVLFFTVFTALNTYWIIPLMRFLLVTTAATSLGEIGYTDWIGSLSENTSLLNVIRLQGAWDWYTLDSAGLPIYIPYATNYFYKAPFIVFSFVIPALTLISLMIREKSQRMLYLVFATIGIIGIFMGVGVHEPTGSLYRLLLRMIPYFSFFRSPWYIFTPYLTISYAVLVGLLVSTIDLKVNQKWTSRKSIGNYKFGFYGLLLILFTGSVLYHYPIFTGKIYRSERPDSFFVEFPDYVFESKTVLDEDQYNSRIITYPDDQLEQFTWGYRGTESILSLFTEEEIIAPSFAFVGKSAQPILDEFYRHLKADRTESALSMLPLFNANTIMVKTDSNSLSRKITTIPHTTKRTVGAWDFYTRPKNNEKIYSPSGYYINQGSEVLLSKMLPVLSTDRITLNSADTEAAKITNLSRYALTFNEAKNITSSSDQRSNHHIYEINASSSGYHKIIIEKQGLDMSSVSIRSDSLSLTNAIIKETDSYYILENVEIPTGRHTLTIDYPEQKNLLPGANINTVYTPPPIRVDELPNNPQTIVAYNPGKKEGTSFQILVDDFSPFHTYDVSFSYKYFYGGVPFVKIIQSHVNAPLKIEPIYTGSDTDWTQVAHTFTPVEIDSKLEIAIETPLKQYENTSKTFIENLAVKRLYTNNVYVMSENDRGYDNPPRVSFEKISPVEYKVSVSGATESYPIVFLENYSPDWVIKGESIGSPLHFSANGYANAWYMPANTTSQTFTIYYKNQSYFNAGLIISGLVILGIMIYDRQKK